MSCTTKGNTFNDAGERCYAGPIAGMLISRQSFSLEKTDFEDLATLKAMLIKEPNRVFIIKDANNYEEVTPRSYNTGTTNSGKTVNFSIIPTSFKLKVERPSSYEVQSMLMKCGESGIFFCMPISLNGFFYGNEKSDGKIYARRFTISKNKLEGNYTLDEMLEFQFDEQEAAINLAQEWKRKITSYSPLAELDGVADVEITVDSASATEIVCSVATKNSQGTNIISSLETANFVKKDSSGAVEAISGVVYADGKYTISGTAFTTGTLDVVPVVTDIPFYETPVSADITVS